MKYKILLYNPRPNPDLKPVDVPLSLLCISRMLAKENYPIKIVSENLYDKHFEVLQKEAKKSLIFGVSAMTGYQILDGIKATKIVKKANKKIKIVWGGWHASLYPTQVLENSHIDIVVKGPGEKSFYEIVKRIEKNKNFKGIPGVFWKEKGLIFSNPDRILESLDNLPPIPYHLIDVERCLVETEFSRRTINYVSSYGCPFRCGFCCEQAVNKRKWVGLNSKAVVDDLERLEKNYKIGGISMYDSNFFVDINRAKEILRLMLKRKLKLRLGNVNGRTKQLLEADNELWQLLKETKTYSILTGAESGSQQALNLINKDIKVKDNVEFAKKCHHYGIKVVFSTLVGLPLLNLSKKGLAKKTDEQISSTIKMFNKILKLDNRHRGLMFIYAPYPGTPLYKNSLRLGFKEPRSLEQWGKFSLYKTHTPWITKKRALIVPMISSYIFMFLDADTIIWIQQRIKNKLKRLIFVMVFKAMRAIAKLRWKYKFFNFPVDYYLYLYARKINKVI